MPLFVFITMLSAFPALSTDMYLPALPTIQEQWSITMAQANLSLVAFFVFFSFFLLVHGPLSDRFGRKPVLIVGVGLYVIGCFLCAFSINIWFLVVSRIIQACGAAAASALAMALAKDSYQGVERQKVLAYIGVIVPLCPMVAPMLGSLMLKYLSWHWIFVCQGVLALLAFYGTIVFKEAEFTKTKGGVLQVVGRYFYLLKNTQFSIYCFSFSMIGLGFFGFLGSSADVYIKHFGLSAQTYALFFGFNALGFMAGSLLCTRLCVAVSSIKILYYSLFGIVISGIAMFLFAKTPYLFAATMFCMTLSIGLSRPVSNHMILETVDSDVGAASSMLTFMYFIFGAVVMQGIAYVQTSKVMYIGGLGIFAGLVPLSILALARVLDKK